jgi:transcriptional regulator with XRE-family HTH domain
MMMMSELARVRRAAGVSQSAAAAKAGVSPPTARNYEKFGAAAVEDPAKLSRLERVYREFLLEASQRAA